MYALITQIHPLVKIRRTRKLGTSGSVTVRLGQKVTTTDILAESIVPTRHHLIDVFRSLGMKSPTDAEKLIQRKPDEHIDKNDIIAETGGMFSRVIRTPVAGKIVSIKNGQVLIETETKKMVVQAAMPGFVAEVIKDHGAIIETNGLLIQGVWGNGRLGFGPLTIDKELIETELTPTTLGIHTRGMVIAAGFCSQVELLSMAASVPVAGLILGGISPRLIQAAMEQLYPILVLDGFGNVGINEYAKRLLISSNGREAALNTEKWDPMSGNRPELVIAMPADAETYSEVASFTPGQIIRVHSAPYLGRVGTVQKLLDGQQTLPNGIRTRCASIKFENNENAVVPLTNMDIIDIEGKFLGKTD